MNKLVKEEQTKIQVDNYGDMLAKIFDMDLVLYVELGSYQGTYIAVLNNNGIYNFYMDYYGSCSGCDWLEAEAEKNYETYGKEVDYKAALEFCQQINLKFAMPKTLWDSLTNDQKQLLVIEDMGYTEREDMLKVITTF